MFVVATGTERLPVVSIPKQVCIAFVCFDVIHKGCTLSALAMAVHGKERLGRFAPFVCVAAL
jgi:hypothetical protein